LNCVLLCYVFWRFVAIVIGTGVCFAIFTNSENPRRDICGISNRFGRNFYTRESVLYDSIIYVYMALINSNCRYVLTPPQGLVVQAIRNMKMAGHGDTCSSRLYWHCHRYLFLSSSFIAIFVPWTWPPATAKFKGSRSDRWL
jgi:hypothetical protein